MLTKVKVHFIDQQLLQFLHLITHTFRKKNTVNITKHITIYLQNPTLRHSQVFIPFPQVFTMSELSSKLSTASSMYLLLIEC